MKKFSDFGIKTDVQRFTGEKIKIERILNRQIIVHDFEINKSKYSDGDCLFIQLEIDNTRRVLFTGSRNLLEMIQKIPKSEFPFTTAIIKDEKYFEFS